MEYNWVMDGANGLETQWVVAYILNKPSMMDDKGQSSRLNLGRGSKRLTVKN
jgi:hypothetical protein